MKKGRAVEAPVGPEIWQRQLEQMVGHTDDTRHDRVASQNGGDLAVLDRDVLVRNGRDSSSIDDLHMLKNHFGGSDTYVVSNLRPERVDALSVSSL